MAGRDCHRAVMVAKGADDLDILFGKVFKDTGRTACNRAFASRYYEQPVFIPGEDLVMDILAQECASWLE
jgi:hypothetical protein